MKIFIHIIVFDYLEKNQDLSENEKKLIHTIFAQELPPDIIFDSLGVQSNLEKQEIIKKYYFSLKKPIKSFPKNTKKLVVKTRKSKHYLVINILINNTILKDIILY